MIAPKKPVSDYASRGGFATAIVNAWFVADSSNREHIEYQWPHMFEPDTYAIIVAEAEELTAQATKLGVKFNYSVGG